MHLIVDLLCGNLMFCMRITRNLHVIRALSSAMVGLILLTLMIQARQGHVQGAADTNLGDYGICESQSAVRLSQQPGSAVISCIVETPSVNSALTGVLRPSELPVSPLSAFCSSGELSVRLLSMTGSWYSKTPALRFIPAQPFSSVLRL
jgi:hypothetical protein